MSATCASVEAGRSAGTGLRGGVRPRPPRHSMAPVVGRCRPGLRTDQATSRHRQQAHRQGATSTSVGPGARAVRRARSSLPPTGRPPGGVTSRPPNPADTPRNGRSCSPGVRWCPSAAGVGDLHRRRRRSGRYNRPPDPEPTGPRHALIDAGRPWAGVRCLQRIQVAGPVGAIASSRSCKACWRPLAGSAVSAFADVTVTTSWVVDGFADQQEQYSSAHIGVNDDGHLIWFPGCSG